MKIVLVKDDGTEVSLTPSEAKRLHKELSELVGEEKHVPYPYPVYPTPPWPYWEKIITGTGTKPNDLVYNYCVSSGTNLPLAGSNDTSLQ